MPNIILKRGRAKPFFWGHPWVFSGSVESVQGQPADGDLVAVLDDRGNFVAKGFFNARSQIRVRLATWDPDEAVDEAYFERRLRLALGLRERTLRLPSVGTVALSRESATIPDTESQGLPAASARTVALSRESATIPDTENHASPAVLARTVALSRESARIPDTENHASPAVLARTVALSRESATVPETHTAAPSLTPHTDAYRLVYSEGDGLPGLIVDRYGDWLVVQLLSVGLAVRKPLILSALQHLCPGRHVFERSDSDVADKEGIEPHVGPLAGPEPPDLVPVTMHGIRLLVDLRRGQKTGLFLDHRDNYRAVLPFAEGRRVLDCFSYTGAFALFASVLGHAASVLAIELSESALALARRNAELNGLHASLQSSTHPTIQPSNHPPDIEFRQGDVFAELRRLRDAAQSFGLVILDPPKFARSTGDVENALRGYKDINLLAMHLLEPGGTLVTCSCSQHVDDATFVAMLNDAAFDTSREVQVIERRSQAPDHPVSVTCPESRYLKCYLCRVL